MDWRTLPKVELHLHLEGAAPPEFIRTLAAEQGVALEGVFDAEGAYQWRDFAEFLECYTAATSVLKTPDHNRRLVEEVLRQSAVQGVVYTELFIAPDISGGGDAGAWAEHLAAMNDGADAVPEVEVRFVSTAIRHLGPAAARRAAEITVNGPRTRLTGFGMGGEERYLTQGDFAAAFAVAGEGRLGLTTHAGEMAGPQSVRDALDHLGVTRIGHGVRAVEDPALVERIIAEDITLEVNPGSNVALGVYPDWQSHPITQLRDACARVTISTDDPPYFQTDLSREYHQLAALHGWTRADFDAQNRVALAAAFCDDATRARLAPLFQETTP